MSLRVVAHPSDIHLCDKCNATFTAPAILQSVPVVATQIRTNYIPQGLEKNNIIELQMEAEKQLSRYDEEISRLRAIIEQVEAQRVVLQELVDGCRCLNAPIRRLPNELLDDIFSRCDWSLRLENPNPLEKAVGLSPLCLSQVCARWRSIGLSSHHLWTYIPLTLRNPKSNPGQGRGGSCATVLCIYLERSGRLPLSIVVNVEDPDSWESSQDPNAAVIVTHYRRHPLLRILARHSRRWRRANLYLAHQYFGAEEVLADIRGNLPLLEELYLGQRLRTKCDIFAACPKLHRIELPVGGKVEVPWKQLTHVLKGSLNVAEAFDVLQSRCPKLVHFSFSVHGLHGEYSATSSDLESISINLDYDAEEIDLVRFFDALTLPRLKSLNVVSEGDSIWPHLAFTSFLRRSACPLHELSLRIETPVGDLVEVLELVPTLTRLDVDGYSVTNALLHSLTYFPADARGSPLLPDLTFIRLNFPEVITPTILDMVESRWLPDAGHLTKDGTVAILKTVSNHASERIGIYSQWELEPTSFAHLQQVRSDLLRYASDTSQWACSRCNYTATTQSMYLPIQECAGCDALRPFVIRPLETPT